MFDRKYIIYWRKSEETEEYTYKGAYDLRIMDLTDWGYVEGEDFTTWTEIIF